MWLRNRGINKPPSNDSSDPSQDAFRIAKQQAAQFETLLELTVQQNSKLDGVLRILAQQSRELNKQAIAMTEVAKSIKDLANVCHESHELEKQHLDSLKRLHWNSVQMRASTDIIRHSVMRPLMQRISSYLDERQLNLLETIRYIKEKRVNLARFGDGEYRLLFSSMYNVSFQSNSPELRDGLRDAFAFGADNPDKLLIASMPAFNDPIWASLLVEFWDEIEPLLNGLPVFGNSHVTRPLIFSRHGQEAIRAWSEVWDGLNVAIVTGTGSRFDLEPELFSSAASTSFHYSTPKDAFSDVSRLVEVIGGISSDIVLISLGPAGTILATELAKSGTWALDIGHLSSSYAQIFRNAAAPELTPIIAK